MTAKIFFKPKKSRTFVDASAILQGKERQKGPHQVLYLRCRAASLDVWLAPRACNDLNCFQFEILSTLVKKMKRRNVRTLSLIVVTFTYLLIGAAVFDVLEGGYNEASFDGLQQIRKDFIAKYNMTELDYKMLETIIIEKQPHKAGPQWKFAGSFYYALVVLSLIGYGHSTPKTLCGKGFTMGYAMLGIPMAMIMFQSMGERMNKVFSIVIKKYRSCRGDRRPEVSEFDLIVASGMMSTVVVTFGAVLYHTQEGWTFFDSLYYCFITLSTIGFGDYVALQSGAALQVRTYMILKVRLQIQGILHAFSSSEFRGVEGQLPNFEFEGGEFTYLFVWCLIYLVPIL